MRGLQKKALITYSQTMGSNDVCRNKYTQKSGASLEIHGSKSALVHQFRFESFFFFFKGKMKYLLSFLLFIKYTVEQKLQIS